MIVLCGCSCNSFAQDSLRIKTFVKKLKELRSEISNIQTEEDDSLRSNLVNSRTIINNAILNLGTHPNDQIPKEYIKSFESLKKITSDVGEKKAKEKIEFSHHLLKDLQLKFPHDKEGQLNSIYSQKLATVKVVTKKNGQEIKDYRVRCSPLGFNVDYTKPYLSFKRLTSPADQNIVPGIYKIWITRDGDFKVLKELETEISPESDNTIVFNID